MSFQASRTALAAAAAIMVGALAGPAAYSAPAAGDITGIWWANSYSPSMRTYLVGGGVRDLFHIAVAEDWAAAQKTGQVTDSTRGVTLEQEGYIHCSYAGQVAATAARFYGDLAEVVVLRIDPSRLKGRVVEEDLAGTGEPFPHVYGPIPIAAVVEARTTSPHAAGG